MTWFWILLWLAFSVIVLGTFFWSTIILQNQKRAWAAFSKKHNLTYIAGKFLESPTITGNYKGHDIACFSALRDPDDPKARKYVSVMEVNLPHGILDSFAAGTEAMHNFMSTLELLKPYEVEGKEWKKDYRLYAKDEEVAKDYLSETRIKHIAKILGLKNADVIVMFDKNEGVVRAETSDPIQEVKTAEQVLNYIIKHLQPLYLDQKPKTDKA